MKEIWKDIPGYEGYYQISNLGNVKSLPRKIIDRNNKIKVLSSRILKQHVNPSGHRQVTLFKNCKDNRLYVHRLVAQCFIPNPNNLPFVNHKDQNPLNNNVGNLEWCTPAYNATYADAIEKRAKSNSIPIIQLDLNGNIINEWPSAAVAGRTLKLHDGDIGRCCKHKANTVGGFKWEFKYPKFNNSFI